MITLRPVDPIGVYNRWDWFRNGIERAIRKTNQHMRPEDAYVRIRAGTLHAYVITLDGDHDIGFVLVNQEHDPDGPVLFLWCMWCRIGSMTHHKDIQVELEKLAKAINAKRIRYQGRPGWEREGFGRPVATVYEREL